MNWITALYLLICSTLLALAGCSGMPTAAQLRPVDPGKRINVVVTMPGIEAPDALDTAEATGSGVGKGAIAGMGIGLHGSFGCGPLFFVCAPYSMAFGAAGGVVAGAAHGASIALPAEKATQLEGIVKDYLSTQDIARNLRDEFIRQQAERWHVVEINADVFVTLGIEKLEFEQHSGDELVLQLTSSLVVQYDQQGHEITKRILLNARTDSRHIDYWIADDGANTRAGLMQIFAENSRQVVAVLSQPISKR